MEEAVCFSIARSMPSQALEVVAFLRCYLTTVPASVLVGRKVASGFDQARNDAAATEASTAVQRSRVSNDPCLTVVVLEEFLGRH